MANHVLAGIMGLCVADALGVPVEFMDRETLKRNPGDQYALLWYVSPAGWNMV